MDAVQIVDIRCVESAKGDVNCDGLVDFDDIDPFVALLVMIACHVPVALISRHPERWLAAGKAMGVTAVVGTALVALGTQSLRLETGRVAGG